MDPAVALNIGAVAMVVSLVIVPVVSLVTAKMPRKQLDEIFDKVEAERLKWRHDACTGRM